MRSGYRIDFAGIVDSIVYDITKSEVADIEERVAEILAHYHGYAKVRRCKDCGAYTPLPYYDQPPLQGEWKVFNCIVPREHYCSYAWKDEDDE